MKISLSDHFTYKKLLKFTFPSIIMMVLSSIYGVVDGYFISNYIGPVPFAAVNIVMPFLVILGALGFMLGTGGSALVAYTLGTGDNKKANEIFSLLIYTLVATGIVFTIIGIIFIKPISHLLGADEEMLPYCVKYGRTILIALVPFMLMNIFQSFLVTAELPHYGLIITIASGVVNVILDALFVAVFKFGVIGAAVATGISQAIGGFIPLFIFIFSKKSKLHLGRTHFSKKALLKSCANGSSEFMSNVAVSLVNMLYNWQLMKLLGHNGVTSYGVIMYVNYIFLSIFFGYSIGSSPVVGYHYGAGNTDELKGLFKKSIRIILVSSVVLTLTAELLAAPLSKIFVSYDKDLLKATTHAFAIYSASFLIAGINIYASSFFTALNDGLTSAIISFFRTLVFQVIAVIVLPLIFGSHGIWFAIIAAEALSLLLSLFFIVSKRKKYSYY